MSIYPPPYIVLLWLGYARVCIEGCLEYIPKEPKGGKGICLILPPSLASATYLFSPLVRLLRLGGRREITAIASAAVVVERELGGGIQTSPGT